MGGGVWSMSGVTDRGEGGGGGLWRQRFQVAISSFKIRTKIQVRVSRCSSKFLLVVSDYTTMRTFRKTAYNVLQPPELDGKQQL